MGQSRRSEEGQEREAGDADKKVREKVDGRQREGSYEAAAGPLTQAGGEVWTGTVSRRADALEGTVSVGTDAALAEVLLAALVHV